MTEETAVTLAEEEEEEEEGYLEIPERAWLLPLAERLRIVDEYRAAYPLEEFPREVQRLIDSFTSPKASKAAEVREEAFRLYYQALQDLEKAALAFREAVAYGKAYVMLEDSVKRTEEIVQDILKEIEDVVKLQGVLPAPIAKKLPKLEKRLQKILAKAVVEELDSSTTATLARLEYDKKLREARLIFTESEDGTIEERREGWIGEAEVIRSNIYTVIKALRDGMPKLNYRPTAFIRQMERILESVSGEVTSQPVLPSRRTRGPRGHLTVISKGRRFPVDQELYRTWIEAIEETKNV